MSTWIALLRGLNVGAHNRISMKALCAVFEAAGCEQVQTYIQSGNVCFSARSTAGLEERVAAALEQDFQVRSPIILREGKALQQVLRANPFFAPKADPATLHVGFLASRPEAAKVKALDPQRSPGDHFQVKGTELYLHTPNGLGRSKLINTWFDKQLGVISTWRNWNTVEALAHLAQR